MGKRILIVDPAPFMRMMLQDALQKNGYEVAGACGSIAEALQQTKALSPDVVITEVLLRETSADSSQNGFSLIRTLREQFPAVVCVVCSSMPYTGIWQEVEKAGAKGFISKPANAQTVRDELEKALRA